MPQFQVWQPVFVACFTVTPCHSLKSDSRFLSHALRSHHATVSSLDAHHMPHSHSLVLRVTTCHRLYSHTKSQSQVWQSPPHFSGFTVAASSLTATTTCHRRYSRSLKSDSHNISQALQSQSQVWQSTHFTDFTVAVSSLTVTTFHRLYSRSLMSDSHHILQALQSQSEVLTVATLAESARPSRATGQCRWSGSLFCRSLSPVVCPALALHYSRPSCPSLPHVQSGSADGGREVSAD